MAAENRETVAAPFSLPAVVEADPARLVKVLPPLAGRLARLPVPFCVDHMGHFPTSCGVGDEGFRTLVSLVRDGAWVKLSGAYRNSVAGPPFTDTVPFARALHDAAPERCVWGSDWPHLNMNGRTMPNDGDLLDTLLEYCPDETNRRKLLVDNPKRLFDSI